ncbi:GyrI-like domain-containing protein [uncultured Senegalimassilia sp.]|uniref:GyrI-like domain-containing protein n=1 Tax=uncultured Senegalimassilia sp. TaxID=1714350 RepID=UPI0025EE7935|nr:GyrI-like domain-containing protein [uncultured Senegalimassilia sp.]
MAYDFKKEFKELYKPSCKPSILTIPPMSYIAVRGKGDPNIEGSEYQSAMPLLYGVAYTLKMSKKGPREIEGYFDFVVPPLEGFWWQDPAGGQIDYARKGDFNFISCIRLPDFVTRDDFDWAISEAAAKKKLDFSVVEMLKVDEGLCVQCMHAGPYDGEPATIDAMHACAAEQGYALDFTDTRLHHEIYLSDPRKCSPEKLKTVIRHPIKPI